MKKISLLVAILCACVGIYNVYSGDWGWAAWFAILGALNVSCAKNAR